jgi:ubiquinone/menaquinone biosynthesis C-methylase UbiE
MGFVRFMASQLRQPTGWFGSMVMSPLLNRVNRQINETTLQQLEIRPEDGVLEVGFGGGSALAMVAGRLAGGIASGVDFSPDMVRQAERRFRRDIAEGRVRVQLGDVSRLPYPDASFDRVLTINTVYFWPDTLQGLGEIRRVLKPDGRAAVAIRSKEKMETKSVTRHGFRLFSPDELLDAMRQAGFRGLQLDHRDQHRFYDQVIVVGTR